MKSDGSTKKRRRAASSPSRQVAPGLWISHEELIRFIADSIDDCAVFCVDPDGRVASWNQGAARIFGYEEAEIVGKPVACLAAPEGDQDTVEQELRSAEREGRARNERWHLRKDGSRFWASETAIALRDPAGTLRGFAKVCCDRSGWKRAEQEQQQSLLREREARKQAEDASRLKDEFVATVSHELRTPLNAILGWTDILVSQKVDARVTGHAIEVIRRNAKAQKQLIEDLLDISQLIAGKLRLDVRPLAVDPIVRAALDTIRPAAHAKSIQLRELLDPDAGWVLGDASRLQQIVWNLLSNAVKFTPKGGQVAVLLRRRHSAVELSVSDTGKGIDPEFASSLFERFRQADASLTRSYAGMGLGLALARHLTELHGGTIRAESAGVSKGSTFILTLPMSPLQTDEADPDAAEEGPLLDEEAVTRLHSLLGLRLLIADDDADSCEFLAFLLRQRGATVHIARSAQEALEKLQQELPDLLISDIGMPQEDGYALIQKVRALPPERGGLTPAIALTAHGRAQDRIRALVAGFHSHVVKPVKPAELIVVVAQLTGRLVGKAE
ncbi:MAG: ATP-binding protein [Polyangia bacterium]